MPAAKDQMKLRKTLSFGGGGEDEDDDDDGLEGGVLEEKSAYIPVVLTTEVKKGSTSATFRIPRSSPIASDGKPHKVTIAIASLPSQFSYRSVPKLAAHAFLHSATTNTTDYPMLPGSANVFLDNNFVATSQLKSVSPGESFSLYLGVDASLVVSYNSPHKFNESSGFLHKVNSTTSEFVTTIKNTKLVPVLIKISDQLPQSTDEKIKVRLIEPDLKLSNPNIRMHPTDYLIDWTITIAPGEEVRIPFKYIVEFPQGQPLEFY